MLQPPTEAYVPWQGAAARSCQGKKRYEGVVEASDALDVLYERTGVSLLLYLCEHCGGYHVGNSIGTSKRTKLAYYARLLAEFDPPVLPPSAEGALAVLEAFMGAIHRVTLRVQASLCGRASVLVYRAGQPRNVRIVVSDHGRSCTVSFATYGGEEGTVRARTKCRIEALDVDSIAEWAVSGGPFPAGAWGEELMRAQAEVCRKSARVTPLTVAAEEAAVGVWRGLAASHPDCRGSISSARAGGAQLTLTLPTSRHWATVVVDAEGAEGVVRRFDATESAGEADEPRALGELPLDALWSWLSPAGAGEREEGGL